MQTVGRLAPSPSGRMHLGNLFSALIAWLSARSAGGRLILRMEDLDPLRTGRNFAEDIMRDLAWLGIDWDEGPYWQGQRSAFYEGCLARLADRGLLYECYCSRAQLHAASAQNPANAPHLGDGSYVYNRRCLYLPPAERAALAARRGGAIRVRVPDTTVEIQDKIQGKYAENLARDCGDFILRRSDGVFAYQLAAPADDGAMGVTQVVRGRDLLTSAPRQAWLMGQLGYATPEYLHLPLLLAPDGRRLSKRDADADLGALRAKYKTPQALVGRLAHLAGQVEEPTPLSAAELLSVYQPAKIPKKDRIITEI